MMAADDGQLSRTPSHTSTASRASRRSTRVRDGSRKRSSNASLTLVGASNSDKSFTSFPSLSPPTSPSVSAAVSTPTNAARTPGSAKIPHTSEVLASTVESLVTATPSMRDRNALFDDDPMDGHAVPGALHHTTDEHIHRLIARNGAVTLVRQLAEDLAQRDAQATALRRRAEERERVLRKMLLECEVSNMDIESCLDEAAKAERLAKQKRRSKASKDGLGIESSIDEMMNQAMSDDVGLEGTRHSSVGHSSFGASPPWLTRAAGDLNASESDPRLVESLQKLDQRPRRTTGGWKDFILGSTGTTRKSSKASSVVSESNDDNDATPRAKGRVGSGASRRKGLHGDLFQPPANGTIRSSSRTASLRNEAKAMRSLDDNDSDAQSQKSSNSVAAWAIKLVAGNPQTVKKDVGSRKEAGAARESRRSSITSGGAGTSTRPVSAESTTKPGLQKARRSVPALSLGPTGTVRAPASPNVLALGAASQNGGTGGDSNPSGPLEMDTILPPGSQPPTLTQSYNAHHPSEYLTDRFGFIYDQRRKKRQKEAAACMQREERLEARHEMLSPSRTSLESTGDEQDNAVRTALEEDSAPSSSPPQRSLSNGEEQDDSQPTKRWQDFLQSATYPTELLSHTPAAGPITTLHTVDADAPAKPTQRFVEGRGTLPSASLHPQPLATTVVSDNATFVKPALSAPTSPLPPTKPQPEPVKLLLDQLTDLHDSLQRDRESKWNEFLRKVRAERRKEGEAAAMTDGRSNKTFVPEASLADGEVIGIAGLGNKGKLGRAKWAEFRHLVLGGIPVAYRAKIWTEGSGALTLRVPGQYDDLVNNGVDDPAIVAQIAMDINRTLTDNVFFRQGPGVAKLNEVLLAYSRRNPEVGYCQGMNLITASLLLIMPTTEDAFWILASLIERILPAKYYDHSLLASRADQQVLRQYVADVVPRLSAHLDALGIELEALTFQWFLSVFTDCLSAEALYRVWDVILCTHDGSTFLFQVALALLKLNEAQLLRCHTPAGVYTYINHQMTNHAISIDGLLQASDALKRVVKREDVEERRARAVKAEEELMKERAERYNARAVRGRAGES